MKSLILILLIAFVTCELVKEALPLIEEKSEMKRRVFEKEKRGEGEEREIEITRKDLVEGQEKGDYTLRSKRPKPRINIFRRVSLNEFRAHKIDEKNKNPRQKKILREKRRIMSPQERRKKKEIKRKMMNKIGPHQQRKIKQKLLKMTSQQRKEREKLKNIERQKRRNAKQQDKKKIREEKEKKKKESKKRREEKKKSIKKIAPQPISKEKKEKNKLDKDTLDDWIDNLMDNVFLKEGGFPIIPYNLFMFPIPNGNDIEDIVNEKNECGIQSAEYFFYNIIKLEKFCENLEQGVKFIEERYRIDEEDYEDYLDDYYYEGDLDNDLDLLD